MPLNFNGSGPVDLGDVLNGQFIKRQGDMLVGDDADFEPAGAVASHAAAADPHTGYQRESEKGAASGYASLDGATKIPIAQVPTGSSSTTVCVGNDARLSDARTPLAHTHPLADITNEGALASLNTVGTSQIDNDSVTYAKIQNVTDARILGRSAGSTGDVHEITAGSGLSLNAGVLSATGGGGGVSQMIVPLISDGAGITWTNMPASPTVAFFGGSHRFATKVDLTSYTQVRLLVNKQGTAAGTNAVVRLRYITAFNTTVANWLQIGESSVQVAVNVQNAVLDSGWIDLAAGAKSDVFIALDGTGSDGVLDPVFGSIVAQFR